jgi:hypothetical protein
LHHFGEAIEGLTEASGEGSRNLRGWSGIEPEGAIALPSSDSDSGSIESAWGGAQGR